VNGRYERARRSLLARTDDLEAAVLDWPVFGRATVRTALVTATRRERASLEGGVRVSVFDSEAALARGEPASEQTANARALAARPGFAFPRGATDLGLETKLRAASRPLEELCWVRDGINPGPRAFREAILVAGERPEGAHVFPCLEGRDVSRFAVAEPRLWIRADPALLTPELKRAGASFRESWIFDSEKLVSRQTAPGLVFARDARGRRALNSVHQTGLLPGAGLSLLALLALLNSSALDWYYSRTSGETRRVFPQVHVAALRKLPVPAALLESPDLEAALASLASRLEREPGEASLAREVDAIVGELFGLTGGESDLLRGPRNAQLPR
jgi:hypothetical protein